MAIIKRIEGATRNLGAPPGWDGDMTCNVLPIKDVIADNKPWMVSAWELTPDELKMLQEGHTIKLWIMGHSHPVVGFTVGELA